MHKGKIRVMIVEDSKLYQLYLRKVIEADSYLEVAGIAENGAQAKRMAAETKPDVMTLDLHLQDVAEFELLRYFLKHTPQIPIIVVSSLPKACEEALRLGAKDFIEKASDEMRISNEHFAALLQTKIKIQASSSRQKERSALRTTIKKEKKGALTQKNKSLIAIGASVGGTESTLEVLRNLPGEMPPILIVQHMPVGFTKAYALRLNQNCPLTVAEAKDGELLQPGKVLIAESGKQMKVMDGREGLYVRCYEGEKATGFCPSVNVLFESIAETSARGVALLMTGMGKDGVDGIKKMHDKGFYTIGQAEESCVVFGMPGAAQKAGALDVLLNPVQIAEELIKQCKNI